MSPGQPSYRLVRAAPGADGAVVLDQAQQAVVDHAGGPLLVLAGPGTGKTTVIVETVVDRVTRRGVDPRRVLVLTFSRRAAEELRQRITGRLARTVREPLALTFHSYAYALVRRQFVAAGEEPPALLSAPQQLLEVRRMLRGEAEDGGRHWPARLRPALATRGFAAELRDFLLRAAERGLDGNALARLGRQHKRDDWEAAGGFFERYAARFDLAPVTSYDYAEIIRIAAGLLAAGPVAERERNAYDLVCVDEYQDTDPAQEALLHALAAGGPELIVVGDPDQSIYGFRGADVGAIMRFRDRFKTVDNRPAPVVTLRTCRRGGPRLLAASRRVARRLPAPPVVGHRDLRPLPSAPPGEVHVLTAASASQEAMLVADFLRRAHLRGKVPWSGMAVLVRSVARQVPALRRGLAAAGVPTVVAGDELPLRDEPAVAPFLLLLRCALDPETLDEQAAAELLTGPLGGTDALGLRRLQRFLRGDAGGHPPAGELPADGPAQAGDPATGPLAAALRDPRELTLATGPAADAARRLAGLLALARDRARGGSAHDVLWAVWQASGLGRAWQAASLAGGSAGLAADRDLDAVCALFEAAAQFTVRLPPGSPRLFLQSLAGQEIPGDTLAMQAPRGNAVQLLTAHRAKGLEWEVVVVAGVQEGVWPDLRTRSSLLGMDELVDLAAGSRAPGAGADAYAAALAAKLLSEERRLFYVATTRARRVLAVTAVGGEGSEERPSRFLAELAGDEIEVERLEAAGPLASGPAGADLSAGRAEPAQAEPAQAGAVLAEPAQAGAAQAGTGQAEPVQAGTRAGAAPWEGNASRPGRWLSLPALTAELRRVAADPARPRELRRHAAHQLARLAAAGVRGAHPGHWYQLTPLSDAGPLVPAGEGPVLLSPSQVESFHRCGLRWLLETAARAGSRDVTRHFGTVIHAAAVLAAHGAGEPAIRARLDEIWPHLDFGSTWYSARQRAQAERMVSRFLAWHNSNQRKLVAVEEELRARAGPVEISGRVDRLEADDQGRAVVVDLKTGSARPSGSELERHPQLGVYQLAVALGAFARFGLTEPGGAELVQVGNAGFADSARVQRQRALTEDPEPGWVAELVEAVAAAMAGPVFQATVNPGCRSCPVRSCCPAHPEGGRVTP
jgi:superfamily I DNA/RNA helicase/RecB family exonuclease